MWDECAYPQGSPGSHRLGRVVPVGEDDEGQHSALDGLAQVHQDSGPHPPAVVGPQEQDVGPLQGRLRAQDLRQGAAPAMGRPGVGGQRAVSQAGAHTADAAAACPALAELRLLWEREEGLPARF